MCTTRPTMQPSQSWQWEFTGTTIITAMAVTTAVTGATCTSTMGTTTTITTTHGTGRIP